MRTRWRSAPRSGRGPRRSIQFGGTRPRCSFCGVVLLSIVVFGVRRRHGSQAVTQQRSGASGDPSPPGAERTARRATRCGSAGRARACSSSQSSTGGWSTRAPPMDGCTRTRPIAEQTPVSVHRFGRALRRASHSRSEPHPTDWSMCPCWLRRTSTVTTRCSRSQRIARTDVSRHGPDGFPTGSRPPLLWGTGRSSSARTRPFERTTRGADSRLAVRHGGSARSTATTTSCRRSWATGSLRWHRVRTSSGPTLNAAPVRASRSGPRSLRASARTRSSSPTAWSRWRPRTTGSWRTRSTAARARRLSSAVPRSRGFPFGGGSLSWSESRSPRCRSSFRPRRGRCTHWRRPSRKRSRTARSRGLMKIVLGKAFAA